jgi:type II secretory ATPase GspE/PulE/Tfp pilus assembly ATPase PilB-like protein
MQGLENISEDGLLRTDDGIRCKPQVEHDLYPRVVDWGMPEDVHAGDFTFSVIEAALAVGASDIQLTPIEESGVVSVHFRIGSEFIRQAPLTQIQFGFIAILLAHIATPNEYEPESPPVVRYFNDSEGTPYFVRFSKIRVVGRQTAILIRLIVDQTHAQFAA